MYKMKAGTVKSNLKGIIKRFIASDNAFSFTSSGKQQHIRNKSYLMVKQLRIQSHKS